MPQDIGSRSLIRLYQIFKLSIIIVKQSRLHPQIILERTGLILAINIFLKALPE